MLVRLLANHLVVEAAESQGSWVQQLAQWLDFADAITLHAAQHVRAAKSPESLPGVEYEAIAEEVARVRTALETSIATSCARHFGERPMRIPTPQRDAPLEVSGVYEPYRRFYVAQQSYMESNVRTLRNHVRQALWRRSEALKQLAVLDEVLGKILMVRERQLLSAVPRVLEDRFRNLLAACPQTVVNTRQADVTAVSPQCGGWLEKFCEELRGVLLAELDFRLQPAIGLMEALRHEAGKSE